MSTLRLRLVGGGYVVDNLEDFDVPERRLEQAQDGEQLGINLWHAAMVPLNGRSRTAYGDLRPVRPRGCPPAPLSLVPPRVLQGRCVLPGGRYSRRFAAACGGPFRARGPRHSGCRHRQAIPARPTARSARHAPKLTPAHPRPLRTPRSPMSETQPARCGDRR